MQDIESGVPILLATAGIVSKAPGTLIGFYVNNTSSGTIIIYNGTTALAPSVAITGTITPAIGWKDVGAYCPAGCYIDVPSGSINLTAIFAAG